MTDYSFFVLNLGSICSDKPNEDLIPLLMRGRGNFGYRSNQSFILASHLSIPPAASRTPKNRTSDRHIIEEDNYKMADIEMGT